MGFSRILPISGGSSSVYMAFDDETFLTPDVIGFANGPARRSALCLPERLVNGLKPPRLRTWASDLGRSLRPFRPVGSAPAPRVYLMGRTCQTSVKEAATAGRMGELIHRRIAGSHCGPCVWAPVLLSHRLSIANCEGDIVAEIRTIASKRSTPSSSIRPPHPAHDLAAPALADLRKPLCRAAFRRISQRSDTVSTAR